MIGIAPETGNAEVMTKIRKGFRHDRVLEIRETCRRLRITKFRFFMIGFPFETRETIEDTISFAKKLDYEMVEFNKVIPYPKTELFDIAVRDRNLLRSQSTRHPSSNHDGEITTHRVGDLSPKEVKKLITRAYREFYLRPSKWIDLLRTYSIRDLFLLTKYAIMTRNI